MSKFIIKGGNSLKGSIKPQGNKNEALPLIAAVLLTTEKVTLYNIPNIKDVICMINILKSINVKVNKESDNTYSFIANDIKISNFDYNALSKIRSSFVLIGPLLHIVNHIQLPHPGGDKIGIRPVNTHINAFRDFNVDVSVDDDKYIFNINDYKNIVAQDIILDEASVTATENIIMFASRIKGKSTIYNAACEPHVQQLCKFINKIGGNITGIGSNMLTIEGKPYLSGCTHTINPDYLEVGSLIALAAVTKSEITILNAGCDILKVILNNFLKLGVSTKIEDDNLIVPANQNMMIKNEYMSQITKIEDGTWPKLPADILNIMLTLATQCHGILLVFEKMFESRMFFVDKLISMGARIVLCDPHRAIIVGPNKLIGKKLSSPDIRAGISLLIAASAAKSESIIDNVEQIDRGYENIENRLAKLGLDIRRV